VSSEIKAALESSGYYTEKMEVNNEIEWHEPMLEVSGARYEG